MSQIGTLDFFSNVFQRQLTCSSEFITTKMDKMEGVDVSAISDLSGKSSRSRLSFFGPENGGSTKTICIVSALDFVGSSGCVLCSGPTVYF